MTAFAIVHDPLGDNPHEHAYPEDWQWGGPDECSPAADPRYKPATYTYLDADTTVLTVVQTLYCDEEALDYFTTVAKIKGSNPTWCLVKRADRTEEMLPYVYHKATDELEEMS